MERESIKMLYVVTEFMTFVKDYSCNTTYVKELREKYNFPVNKRGYTIQRRCVDE